MHAISPICTYVQYISEVSIGSQTYTWSLCSIFGQNPDFYRLRQRTRCFHCPCFNSSWRRQMLLKEQRRVSWYICKCTYVHECKHTYTYHTYIFPLWSTWFYTHNTYTCKHPPKNTYVQHHTHSTQNSIKWAVPSISASSYYSVFLLLCLNESHT